MFWVDPEVDVALVALTDRPFDAWALSAWPELSDAVLDDYRAVANLAENLSNGKWDVDVKVKSEVDQTNQSLAAIA